MRFTCLPLAMMRARRIDSLRCAKVSVVTLWNCHQKEVSVLSVGTKNAAAVAADAEKKCRTLLEHTQTMLSFGENHKSQEKKKKKVV